MADEVKEDPADEWHSLARRVWDSGEGERIVAALLKRVVEGAPAMIATKAPAEAITPRPAAERHDDRPREDRPREDRPRDERRTRERGERDRGRGGDRDRGRGGDRDRGRGGDRDRRPPARAGEPSRADKPAGEAPAGGGGGESSGREFWETWVDEKAQETAPGVPNPAEGVSEAAPDREARERRPRRERPELPPEEPGFVRLYVNVGKREGLSDEDVTRLAKEASPEPEAIGKVLVMGTHSYVSVKEEQAGQVMASLMGKKVGEREVLVERARK